MDINDTDCFKCLVVATSPKIIDKIHDAVLSGIQLKVYEIVCTMGIKFCINIWIGKRDEQDWCRDSLHLTKNELSGYAEYTGFSSLFYHRGQNRPKNNPAVGYQWGKFW